MNKAGFSISPFPGKNFLYLLVLFIFLSAKSFSQPPQFKVYNYIEKYSEAAINQMAAYNIPASVIMAQAIFESSSGTSELAKKSNNHFGIKCHVGWVGDTIVKHDDSLNECFRSYPNIEDSYTDHSLFLTNRLRYSELFKLSVTDYKAWCIGLKNAGYATAPNYAFQLIKLIEDMKLYELDVCEPLAIEVRHLEEEPEIRFSKYTGKGFSVRDFSKSGYLWLDAADVSLRSLDLLVKGQNSNVSDIAGN